MDVDERSIAIVATLDTKAAEVNYLAERLRDSGRRLHIIDVGVLGRPGATADTDRAEVARLGGAILDVLVQDGDPGAAMLAMGRGAQAQLLEMLERGQLDGVVGIAGGKGTALFGDIVDSLPFALTKVIVTSARTGVIADLAGRSNTVIVPTLVDLMGVNDFSRQALDQAVSIAAAADYQPAIVRTQHTVAVSSFGVTTPAAMRCVELLEDRGCAALVFPANGAGGRLLERFIDEEIVDAVIDLTTTELADELVGGQASAGPERLRAAGRRGIPAWIAPGAVDMVNFGPRDTVPDAFADRLFFQHSSKTTLMRTTPEENYAIGRATGQRVSDGCGPRAIVMPQRGVSAYDSDGGPFWDPQADLEWWRGVTDTVGAGVQLRVMDLHINDPAFAELAVDWIDTALTAHSQRNDLVQQS